MNEDAQLKGSPERVAKLNYDIMIGNARLTKSEKKLLRSKCPKYGKKNKC